MRGDEAIILTINHNNTITVVIVAWTDKNGLNYKWQESFDLDTGRSIHYGWRLAEYTNTLIHVLQDKYPIAG